MNKNPPLVLCILDGWGISEDKAGNAVKMAATPVLDELFNRYPWTALQASGVDVGLIPGQMGDSNVGHLNMGAGRVVYQWLGLINAAIEDGSFYTNVVIEKAMSETKSKKGALHLLGLLSDGGVHSHINHLKALLKKAYVSGVERVYLHAFLDGRDVPPQSAQAYLEEIEEFLKEVPNAKLATVSGRFYPMDRDQRWERTQLFWQAFSQGQGQRKDSGLQALLSSYEEGVNDEFLLPTILPGAQLLADGDTVFFFNYRADRLRQMAGVLTQNDFQGFDRGYLPKISLYSMTSIAEDIHIPVAFEPQDMALTLGEVLANGNKKQLHLAETEKYAHVTFFFNGGQEKEFDGEDRILVPSPKVLTYDLQPAMSALKITESLTKAILKKEYDFILVNFANGDMVGHTGVWAASLEAMETLDGCVEKIYSAVQKVKGVLILTADHGNIEQMLDSEGHPHTAHTTNPVPFLIIAEGRQISLRAGGRLADIAPTVLELMKLDQPRQMTGESLLMK